MDFTRLNYLIMKQLWCILDIILGLNIKLYLDYEILNLGLINFVLIYQILGLTNWAYVLAINLKFLD